MKNYEEIAYLRTESTFHIEKAFDKGYDRGYNDCKVELTDDEAKCHYQEGYNDGYRKGVERGREARVAEADCAYQCGLRRAWEAARKIVLSPKEGGLEATTVREIFGMPYESALMKYSSKNAIEMIEAWEKKNAPEKNVGIIENRDKIVKAIAGLLAAYGEQLWDVVADMEKNP